MDALNETANRIYESFPQEDLESLDPSQRIIFCELVQIRQALCHIVRHASRLAAIADERASTDLAEMNERIIEQAKTIGELTEANAENLTALNKAREVFRKTRTEWEVEVDKMLHWKERAEKGEKS